MKDEFNKFATKGLGLSSMTLDRYRRATDAYINPQIIEERQLNVASMDVFSRLMMDRIIFLGVPIDDDVANIIQAQLLFLASTDSSADISLYLNTPGGQVTSGLAIYDTMQLVEPDVATICTGMAASMGSVLLVAGEKGKRSCLPHSRVLIHQPELDQNSPGVFLHRMDPPPIVCQIQMGMADQRHVAGALKIRVVIDLLLNIGCRLIHAAPGFKIHKVQRLAQLPGKIRPVILIKVC